MRILNDPLFRQLLLLATVVALLSGAPFELILGAP